MLTFDARIKNSDATQPRVTNVKTPNVYVHMVVVFLRKNRILNLCTALFLQLSHI